MPTPCGDGHARCDPRPRLSPPLAPAGTRGQEPSRPRSDEPCHRSFPDEVTPWHLVRTLDWPGPVFELPIPTQ